jgi:hypothetical protein
MGGSNWDQARWHVDQAIARLTLIRTSYEASDLPRPIKTARMQALDAKIDALRAVHLDCIAVPWCRDEVLT